jgi:acyl-homoserine-lactone acylase
MPCRFHIPVWLAQRLTARFAAIILALSTGVGSPSVSGQDTTMLSATIERDIWGIPHVRGATDPDAAFGLGYAMAEDTYRVIESSIPYYRGTAGRFFGPDAAKRDYLVHWLGLLKDINEGYDTILQPATREYLEAFAAGITDYAEAHPSATELDILPITGKDLIAAHMLRHLLFYGFDTHITALLGDERAQPISVPGTVMRDGQPTGSNAIAVGPTRSSDGSTMLVINSHQPLTGPVAWYEAHIQSDEGLNVMGGLFPGAPAMGVGFTPTTAWGATVNKPDLVDVYVLEMHPEEPDLYKLDGEWLKLEREDVEIDVLIWGFIPWSVTETIYRSVHGPVMKTEHGTYAVRYAGMGELRQVEQWLAMNKAKDFEEWIDAVRLNHIQSFNFVFAGASGDIYFVHNAEMPLRASGWQWQQYLPGDRRDLIWKDYHGFDDLPQILNPTSGFILSANQSPFAVSAADSNPEKRIPDNEAGWQTRMTNRSVRGLELFEQHQTVSEADLLAIKHDHVYAGDYRGIAFLNEVIALPVEDSRLQEAQQILANWDRATNKENRGAPLGVCILSAEWLSESAGTPRPDPLITLEECVEKIIDIAGRLEPLWGGVNRHGRDDRHFAMAGGPDTLRAAYSSPDDSGEFTRVTGGDGLYYLVRWDSDGRQWIRGVHQYGNHFDNPDDPHYHDQAEDFANEIMHPALFDPKDRAAMIERRYTVSRTLPD